MDGILKADYGDRNQREANLKPADRARAQQIEANFKARRASMGPRELPTPPRSSSPVPFWDNKFHGPAYGGHAAAPVQQTKVTKVEIRPGVYHTVETAMPNPGAGAAGQPQRGAAPGRPLSAPHARPGAAGAAARAAAGAPRVPSARPSAARPGAAAAAKGAGGSPGTSARPALPCEVDTLLLAPALARLEERMRAAVRAATPLHVKERVTLMRAVGKAIGKRDVEIGVRDAMTRRQFSSVWATLGVDVEPALVDALFNKYGHTAQGLMPVNVFVDALLYGAPRQIMLENDWVQRGAYTSPAAATHTGKIQYPECKKGVWPPSDWDPRLAERSAQLPAARLQLEFVYGYDGFQATSPNIFYLATGEVVYFAAAVGIVYNKGTHTQRLFLEHDDDILCLAVHPDKATVATGQVGKDPAVIVWDTGTLKPLVKLQQGYGNRGVQAACFSSSGTKLAVVCLDNSHTLYVWDWPRKQCLMERKTMPGAPPSTYGVVWSPFEYDRLVAYGKNFIKFYDLIRPEVQQQQAKGGAGAAGWDCAQNAGVFSIAKTHTIFSAVFLPSGVVLTGNGAGAIGTWKGHRLVAETPAHAQGPLEARPDGVASPGGLRCLVLQSNAVLLSGGADGYVIKWDVSKGELGAPLQRIPMLRPDQMGVVKPPALRGLDCLPNSEVFIAGTASCDVWEVDETPEVLIPGQQGDLYGLAMNPAYPHVFATACESDTIVVWSAATRKPLRIVQMAANGDMARSCAFSPNGEHLAVGMTSGGVKVMEFHPALAQVYWGRLLTDSVDDMKYSPCGRFLAAGSHDQNLDVYDVQAGYRRVARCVGHSSTILHLDWSVDGSVIQSNDQAYEILYFDPKTGKQIKENQRDTKWHTWTCTLGFPVMGIWPPDSDGTEINSVSRSPSGRYLLTADDHGKVSLFNYPVVIKHAPALRYGGHSSHVMNVRWSADEKFAISVGGRDRCIFQWRIVPESRPPDHFYGRQPLEALDKQGLVYRMTDGSPTQQQQQYGSRAGPGQWASASPPPGGVRPTQVRAQASNAPVSGGGYGRAAGR